MSEQSFRLVIIKHLGMPGDEGQNAFDTIHTIIELSSFGCTAQKRSIRCPTYNFDNWGCLKGCSQKHAVWDPGVARRVMYAESYVSINGVRGCPHTVAEYQVLIVMFQSERPDMAERRPRKRGYSSSILFDPTAEQQKRQQQQQSSSTVAAADACCGRAAPSVLRLLSSLEEF